MRPFLILVLTLGLWATAIPASAAGVASPARVSDSLRVGQVLKPGQLRRSPNGRYTLVMQKDGNLVLYRGRKRALWSSQTARHRGARVGLRKDGNLVVYARSKQPLFATGTETTGADARRTRLVVTNRGDAVLVRSGRRLWSARTDIYLLRTNQPLRAGQSRRSRNGRYVLAMESDGNLVLSDRGTHRIRWSSQTPGNPGASAVLGRDGNFVVYATGRRPLFSTRTPADAHAVLAVQNDGNLVLYASARRGASALWSSEQARSRLTGDEVLAPGQSRESPDRRYLLYMQTDGNLVLQDTDTQRPVWSSQTAGNPGAHAIMQSDGNFVVYSQANQPLYTTGTIGQGGAVLTVGSTLAVVSPSGALLWTSDKDRDQLATDQALRAGQFRESTNGRYRLLMQPDGDLVFFNLESGARLWSSRTGGHPGVWATLQPDGNLVVRSASNQALFATNSTNGDAGSHLQVQDDANLVIYNGAQAPIWSRAGDGLG